MEARTAHRPWQDSGLSLLSGHRALAMHPQLAPAMTLKRDMIVIDGDHRLPTDAALQRSRQHLTRFLCHSFARSRGELPGPKDIVKVLFASIRFRIDRTQSSFDRLRARQMMVADHLSERS